ncbi:MAG: hypothetical protein HZB80_06900 [Deltaproteobacteria bacterium]|nr:hypothetical protein [Deltaproteobacteria bacterium]
MFLKETDEEKTRLVVKILRAVARWRKKPSIITTLLYNLGGYLTLTSIP